MVRATIYTQDQTINDIVSDVFSTGSGERQTGQDIYILLNHHDDDGSHPKIIRGPDLIALKDPANEIREHYETHEGQTPFGALFIITNEATMNRRVFRRTPGEKDPYGLAGDYEPVKVELMINTIDRRKTAERNRKGYKGTKGKRAAT